MFLCMAECAVSAFRYQDTHSLLSTCSCMHQGGVLAAKILSDATFVDEVKMAKTREECMLVVWKLHNIVTATIKPTAQMFPVSLGIKATQFDIVNQPSDKHFVLSTINPNIRKQLIDALTTRWKAKGGELTNQHWTKRDMLNLPPDRTMLGRAFWTYLHTLSVYMDHDPQPEAVERYKAMFDVINNIYACPVCRGHFQKFYPDPVIQHEHKSIASKHDCIMFTWKIHNIVTSDGINRDEWPDKTPFPKSKYHKLFNLTQFLVPSPHADEDQMRTKRCAKTTDTCLGKDDHFEIVADVEARWQIEGGIDQPLKDDSPPACDPPAPDVKVPNVCMFCLLVACGDSLRSAGRWRWESKWLTRVHQTGAQDGDVHHGQVPVVRQGHGGDR